MERTDTKPGMLVFGREASQGGIAFVCAELGAAVDCFESKEGSYRAVAGDPRLKAVDLEYFLATRSVAVYDRVVANPQFRAQADTKHTLHVLRFLAPIGKLVSHMSAEFAFCIDNRTKAFRELVACRVD